MSKDTKEKLERLYSGLEWYCIGNEMKDYLYNVAFMGTTYEWRNKRREMFDAFIAFATGNNNVDYLNNETNSEIKVIQNNPDDVMRLVFGNLKNYILQGEEDREEMGNGILEFLNYYAVKNNIVNPYNEASIREIEESKIRTSRQKAWALMINSSKMQKRLQNGSTLTEEIDGLLDKYNIKIVVPKYVSAKDVRDLSQVTFLKRKEDNPNEYIEIIDEEKSELNDDMISLHIASSSLNLSYNVVKLANDSSLSLTTTNPYLLVTVKNMKEEAENVKRLCFPSNK